MVTPLEASLPQPFGTGEEILAGEAPGCGGAGEEAPFVAGSELGGTIGTEVHRDVILAVEVVGGAAQEGHDGPLGPAGALSAQAALVTAVQAPDGIAVLGGEVAAGAGELLPVGSGGRCAAHNLEVVLLVEGIAIGEDVVVHHAKIVAAAVAGLAVLGAAILGLERIQEGIAVNPAAVHGDRALEARYCIHLGQDLQNPRCKIKKKDNPRFHF